MTYSTDLLCGMADEGVFYLRRKKKLDATLLSLIGSDRGERDDKAGQNQTRYLRPVKWSRALFLWAGLVDWGNEHK